MKKPTITTLSKYISAIRKLKKKYVTSDLLSKHVGVYPEIINETFSYFDPMVNMDYQYNLMDLLDEAEKYLQDLKEQHAKEPKQVLITKRKLDKYESIGDFIYQKMTIGGIVDRNIVLTDIELRALKRLINEEQAVRKAEKAKNKKKK